MTGEFDKVWHETLENIWRREHPIDVSVPPETDDSGEYVGTCQGCGAYWDVRFFPVCPHCHGSIG